MQTYIVQSGDSIVSIASKFNVRVIDLVKENNLTDVYYLTPGLELIIPNNSINDKTNPDMDNFFQYYTVKKEDNLYKIGLEYGLTSQEIAYLNGLEVDEYLFPDQQLKLPKAGVKMYFTKKNDTLNNVADMLNVSTNEILKNNSNIYLLEYQLLIYK